MRFYPKKDNVHWSHICERTRDCGPRHEISIDTLYLHTVFLHGAKVWAAGEESDIESGLGHAGADIGSDCPGSRDQEFHALVFHGTVS